MDGLPLYPQPPRLTHGEQVEREAIRTLVQKGGYYWAIARGQKLRRPIENRLWERYEGNRRHPASLADAKRQAEALLTYLDRLDEDARPSVDRAA
jgi:hypothetical protein